MQAEQKDKKLFVTTIFLVVLHLAGIIGILSSYSSLFLMLSPFNLLISTLLLFLNHKDFNRSFYIFCVLCFSLGFTVEIIGVNTGMLFGNYSYGYPLGIKIAGVPLIIGINWLMLIYSVGVICDKLKISVIIKSLLGAAMLVILDFFIEVVAVKYDFWSWDCGAPPILNFIDWLVVSFLFLLIFNMLKFNKENRLAKALFIVQLVFFVILTFYKGSNV